MDRLTGMKGLMTSRGASVAGGDVGGVVGSVSLAKEEEHGGGRERREGGREND